jgi:hypothetical protein
MTPQQIEQFRIKAKTELGFNDAQVDGYLRSKGISPVSIKTTAPKQDFKISDVGKGFIKGAQDTVANLGTLGQKGLDAIAKPITEKVTGKPYEPTMTLKDAVGDKFKPTNTAQKVGFGAEKIGEFFVPGGAGLKATKGASLLTRAGTEALGTGLVTTAQGSNLKDTATMAGIAGAIPIVGKLASIAATPVKKVLAEKISPALLNKYILRPVARDFHFGKDPGLGVAKEGLKANTREGLLKEITTRKKLLGSQIDSTLQAPAVTTKKIDIKSALAGLDKKIARAAEEGEEVLYSRLSKIREGITGKFKIVDGKAVKFADRPLQLTPLEAAQLKRKIGSSSKWTGQAFDQEVNQARVEVYRALNEMIDKAAPGSRALNARYANMLTAEKALENTINVAKRQYPFGLINAGIGATAAGGSFLTGDSAPEAIAKGLVIATGAKALQSTAVQSRLAAKLSQMGPEQRSLIAKAIPLLKNVLLGISQTETEEPDMQSDQQQSELLNP